MDEKEREEEDFGERVKKLLSQFDYSREAISLSKVQYPITVSEFQCICDGEKIVGKLYLPEDGRSKREIVILSHGYAAAGDLCYVKAKSLAAAGVPTITFDFRGGSLIGKSEGKSENMTIFSEKRDLNAVIEYALQLSWVDAKKLYLSGESLGGMVTALVAAERKDIGGIVLFYPALHTPESARETFATVDDIPEATDTFELKMSKAFWKELWEMDVYEEIQKYKGKVIIMHGTEDQAVDPQYVMRANQLYEDSELFLIEGAGHGFANNDEKSVLKTFYAFIQKMNVKIGADKKKRREK